MIGNVHSVRLVSISENVQRRRRNRTTIREGEKMKCDNCGKPYPIGKGFVIKNVELQRTIAVFCKLNCLIHYASGITEEKED